MSFTKWKIPPPSLLSTTTVRGGLPSPSLSSARPLVSCKKERSPKRSVAGLRVPAANPAAVDSTPSMPEAPREAAILVARGAPARRGGEESSKSDDDEGEEEEEEEDKEGREL